MAKSRNSGWLFVFGQICFAGFRLLQIHAGLGFARKCIQKFPEFLNACSTDFSQGMRKYFKKTSQKLFAEKLGRKRFYSRSTGAPGKIRQFGACRLALGPLRNHGDHLAAYADHRTAAAA